MIFLNSLCNHFPLFFVGRLAITQLLKDQKMKNLTGTKVIISLTFFAIFVSHISVSAFAQKKKIMKVDTAVFEKER